MSDIVVAPSILAADFSRIGDEVEDVATAGADWIHIDVMDGHFVPNLTFGPDAVRAIRSRTDKTLDVHLMVAPCDIFLDAFANAGADIISVHFESGPHPHRLLQAIRGLGKKAGLALNPATPESCIENVLDSVDVVTVMSVNPGFGGQIFLPSTLKKLSRIRSMIDGRQIRLEVDGGVTAELAQLVTAAGADTLVAGSAVFGGGPHAYARNISAIRNAALAGVVRKQAV